ncbi:hypothetical protein RBWH47_04609 [Rhodopirellula baltica WH47]|jgi:hypothetical protein|uniref:Uncharacterized protein n=1 Tax=Rhodopirellula baltica WH47 TaxID=991778 RepID=F2AQ82_RHOBT|nr:hypothetical protein RBWH47_04609 [Rhodopirellula baltica WH47]
MAVEMFRGGHAQPFDVFNLEDLNEEVIRSLITRLLVDASS